MIKTHALVRTRPWLLAGLFLAALGLTGCSTGSLTPTSWPGLAVDQSSIYVASGQAVFALDPKTGSEKWRYPEVPERNLMIFAAPAPTEDSKLIFGAYDNRVYALTLEDRQKAWTFEGAKGKIVGSPVVAADLVLVPSADAVLYALEAASGKLAWSFRATQGLWSAPLVEGERIFLASLDHHLYALDLTSGREIWKVDLGSALTDMPSLAGDLLLAGTFGNKLYALEAETGKVRWELEADDWVWGNPAVDEEMAYFGDLSGVIRAVHLANGKVLWSKEPGGRIVATPVTEGSRLYVVSEAGALYALDKSDGTVAWQASPGGKLYSDPILTGETLVVAALGAENLAYAYDIGSGSLLWSFKPAEKK